MSPDLATYVHPDPVRTDLDFVQAALPEIIADKYRLDELPRTAASIDYRYPYSRVRKLLYRCSGRILTVFLKRATPAPDRIDLATRSLTTEADMLQLLAERMPMEAARFIALFPEKLTLATESCDGTPFDRVIAGAPLSWFNWRTRRYVTARMEQSGAWLRRFHELTAAPEQDLSAWVKFQTGEADWRMHKLVVIDPANAPLYTACARKFETEIRQFKNAKSVCMTHGDYAPHNIFVTPDGRLQVLDFYAARNGHPFADIVNYVAKITGFAENIGFSNAKAGAFVRSFLLGYGDLEQSAFPVLRLLLVLQVLKRMAVIRSRRRSALGIVTTDYYRKRYLPYLQRFMSDELPSLTNPWPWPNLPPITR